ncbi:hypothetical protein XENTR_v10007889, partial [Xenopus tropicalis]
LSNFSWSNCEENLPGRVKHLIFNPNVISFPGILNFSESYETNVPLISPLKIVYNVEREILGDWINVPCFENFGSCTLDNLCNLLDLIFKPGEACPALLSTYNIPCHCPFKAGTYTFPKISIHLPNLKVPTWLVSGKYHTTEMIYSGEEKVSCTQYSYSLQ